MIIFAKNNLNLERSEQELVRRDKLKQLRALGIDPYPAAAFRLMQIVQLSVMNLSKENKLRLQVG